MAKPPFKVKAVFEYTSEHDEDLHFPNGQIITVTSEEGDDWYEGEYHDASGGKHEGIFPKNFVEPYEPEVPSRPVRAPRPKKESEPAPAPVEPEPPAAEQDESEEEPEPEPPKPKTRAEPVPAPPPVTQVASPPAVAKPPAAEATNIQPSSAKAAPPPVSEKPTGGSFRDRIAAFNKSAAPPIAPFKPSNLGSSSFIKKPFVAPPPSRNAYVPPPREPPPQKVYRREEDASVIAQEAEQEEAEKILSPTAEDDDQPKPTSLKERIALLQKQQMEQAQRHAEAAEKKERKKPPPKPRGESFDTERKDSVHSYEEVGTPEAEASAAIPPKPRRERPPEPTQSDGNEADHSAAGETEEAEEVSTDAENEEVKAVLPDSRSPRPDLVQDEEQEEEEGALSDEEDMDPEVKRRMELRERMAKVSGGMGMYGMFGPPGGMPMPGGAPRQKRPEGRTKEPSAEADSSFAPAPPVPGMALPGMAAGPKPPAAPPRAPPKEELAEESEDDRADLPTPTSPRPPEHRDPPPPIPSVPRPAPRAPPAVPSERAAPPPPPIDCKKLFCDLSLHPARPPPPPPPAAAFSPSEGSASDDELSSHAKADDSGHAAQSRESTPVQTQRRNTDDTATFSSPTSPSLRSGRAIPPIPGQAPEAPPASRPPPLPPTSPPNAREAAKAKQAARGNSEDEVTEYEGDYDTDIGNATSHKDALTAHARESSLDDDESLKREQTQVPRPQAAASRNLPPPPPPPAQPPRRPSADIPRSMPPPIPRGSVPDEDDDEYDPYRYAAPVASGPTSPGIPIQRRPTIEEDLYSSPPARPAQPPPPPVHDRAPPPPPPQDRAPPPAPPSEDPSQKLRQPSRTSSDEPRFARRSTDQARSGDHAFIAGDIDLGENAPGPKWWSQPNALPPSLHGRKDIFFESEEQVASKRDGSKSVTRDLYVVFLDYSKSIITAKFDAQDPERASLEQRHEPPPSQPRQDQLEQAYEAFGSKLAEMAASKQNSVVGDGEPQSFVMELLKPLSGSLGPIGSRAYGAPVYTNLANASVQQFDEIRSGDIITLRNAKFQGHRGAVHSKYSMDVGKPDHVGIVVDWDGTKKKIRAWEQGRENKKVKMESFKMGDLRSGEVKVWRVMPRSWIGWDA